MFNLAYEILNQDYKNCDISDMWGNTLLHKITNAQLAKELLPHIKYRPNQFGVTPMDIAVKVENHKLVRLYLSHETNPLKKIPRENRVYFIGDIYPNLKSDFRCTNKYTAHDMYLLCKYKLHYNMDKVYDYYLQNIKIFMFYGDLMCAKTIYLIKSGYTINNVNNGKHVYENCTLRVRAFIKLRYGEHCGADFNSTHLKFISKRQKPRMIFLLMFFKKYHVPKCLICYILNFCPLLNN
jgi:hypothetical protein